MLLLLPIAASLLAGCSDYDVTAGVPEAELSSQRIDFGEVMLGYRSTIGIEVRNVGTADLSIESATLDGTTSGDFDNLLVSDVVVGKGESVELTVRYTPDVVGQDYGNVVLTTNHPDQPLVEVPLSGFGVQPGLDLDPDLLWFGEVPVGDSVSRTFTMAGEGTGTLTVTDIALSDDVAGVYQVTLPGGAAPPVELTAGLSMDVVVTFTPDDDGERVGELLISTNAPGFEEEAVALYGNTADDPGSNAAPLVRIQDPDEGAYLILGDTVTITASVIDEEDPPEALACLAYAGTAPLGSGFPTDEGVVEIDTTALPAGTVPVTVRCLDSEGLTGEDDVDVVVWDPEEPIQYSLSGGDTPFDWWTVDDDVAIYIDGTIVYADTNHTKDTHPPVTLEAELGQTVRIVVTDYNYCDTMLSPLTLHFGLAESQPVTDGFCRSACPTHECYDRDYDGPWPGAEWETEFVVAIPE